MIFLLENLVITGIYCFICVYLFVTDYLYRNTPEGLAGLVIVYLLFAILTGTFILTEIVWQILFVKQNRLAHVLKTGFLSVISFIIVTEITVLLGGTLSKTANNFISNLPIGINILSENITEHPADPGMLLSDDLQKYMYFSDINISNESNWPVKIRLGELITYPISDSTFQYRRMTAPLYHEKMTKSRDLPIHSHDLNILLFHHVRIN